MAEQPPDGRTPIRGEPLPWGDADLDAESAISAADVDAAVALWKRHVKGPLGELLDAEPMEGQRGG